MKFKEIEKIGNKISKKYGMPNVIVDKVRSQHDGRLFAQVRTELVSYEGGDEFMNEVEKKLGYERGYQGGCVYEFYGI